MAHTWVGQPLRRLEDERLLRGRGRYVADLRQPGALQVAILRSPHAHARITRLEAGEAARLPGVLRVVTAADLQGALAGGDMAHPVLAGTSVHYVGQPVAAVVAANRYVAEDARDLIRVGYEPLPALVDVEAALQPGAPPVVEGLDNLAESRVLGYGDWAAAWREAPVRLRFRLRIHRASAHPLETRGIVAWPDAAGEGLEVWCATQGPHDLRRALAEALQLPEYLVRVRTPDVGGGFGVKNRAYPEDYLIAWLARELQRPVQWLEDRQEHFLATVHEREQLHDVEVAATRDGRLLGLRDRYYVDNGAFLTRGLTPAVRTALTIPGPYHLPAYEAHCLIVRTNKTPIGPYRGAGRPQGCFVMERAMDHLARELGLDRAEIRRRNFIQPDEFPYDTGLRDGRRAVVYDSGNYPAGLEKLLALVDYEHFPQRQQAARAQGRYIGLGLACNVEDTGGNGYEGARVEVDGRGCVTVFSGSVSQGQGHETAYAQIVADILGLEPREVRVVLGDTATIPLGVGTFGSRSAVLAGNALREAASEVRRQLLDWAAQLLEAAPEDIELAGGRAFVRGAPATSVSLAKVAAAANPVRGGPGRTPPGGLGISHTAYFQPAGPAYASGAVAAVVEVDPETGLVRVLDYCVVHDCGTVLNPLLVEGQVHGGVSHGLSTALLEELVYDENGQPQTATYMDYLLPTACDVPTMRIEHMETPSPVNPFGIKGQASRTIPALPVLASAIEDALSPWGVSIDELPASPASLFRLLQGARARPG